VSPLRRSIGPLASCLASIVLFAAAAAGLDHSWRSPQFPAKPDPAEEPYILGALVDYQRLYQDFFTSGGKADLLNAFPANKELRHFMFSDIGYLGRSGLVMVQDLAEATVVDTSMTGPQKAEVVVYEQWNWTLQRGSDRKLVSELKGLGQGFRYRLEREGGRWLVAGWDLADVPAPPRDLTRKW
jgi:hypothetical protein